MNNQELKPCPFCGSTSLKVESKHNGQWTFTGTHSVTVRCNKCHARGSTASRKVNGTYGEREVTMQKAIELWNRRVNENESSI